MIRRRATSSQSEQADVDITPLLDIVFILLIFFIVTASFLNGSGVGLQQQNSPEDETRPPPTLVLSVQKNGYVRVNSTRLIDPRSVKSVVSAFMARKPHGVVLVNAAPDASVNATVLVLDQSRLAGVHPAIGLQKGNSH